MSVLGALLALKAGPVPQHRPDLLGRQVHLTPQGSGVADSATSHFGGPSAPNILRRGVRDSRHWSHSLEEKTTRARG